MNQLLRKRTARLLSSALVFVMLVPAWMLTLAATPAAAQSQSLSVGVIDFRNESGIQGEMLSRLATDAVALELAKQPAFDVLPRTQVAQQMKTLGITPPLNKIGLSKLGEALFADAMVEGSIRSVQIKGTGAGRKAAVTLVVRMLDQSSGEVINGGVQTGYSNPRVGYTGDDDALMTEAIDNAAFLVVKTMSEYIIPQATVQNWTGPNEVLLNKGSRDGIKRGMRMIVKRDKEIIGYLQVSSVNPIDSTAAVVRSMRGVKAEDKATAIFDMPAVSELHADPSDAGVGAPPPSKSGPKMSGIRKVLLPVALLGGLALLIRPGTGAEKAGIASAREMPDGSGVQVNWNSNALWGGKNVIEAHVWRQGPGDPATPILAPAWTDGMTVNYTTPVTTTFNTAAADGTETNGTTTVPAMVYGQSYHYKVSALYTKQSFQTQNSIYEETLLSDAGRVTMIQPMTAINLLNPAMGESVNLLDRTSNFTFDWNGQAGADTYVVQVSASPSFPSNATWSSGPVISSPSDTTEKSLPASEIEKLRTWISPKLSTSNNLDVYWRVRYCNSQDTYVRNNPSVDNYLWSDQGRFTVPEMPPLPQ